jgi:D-threo-aldose 1-dehydrogenase
MEMRRLGASTVEVSVLGFGGAPYGAVGDRLTETDADAMVTLALEGGIRYFDTAPLYGHGLSERRLGRVLSQVARNDFVLSSKVGRLLVPLEQGERYAGMRDQEPWSIRFDYGFDGARRSLEESLCRLGLDRVDVLFCHDIDVWTHGDRQPQVFATALGGALRALGELREQGVIGAFGVGVNEWPVCAQVLDHVAVDCFLLAGRFTLLEQDPLDVLLPKCAAHDVSLIIGGPYNSGLLAATERRRASYDYQPASDEMWARAQAIRRLCDAHGVDIRAAALQYPLRHATVAAVIPGPRSVREVEENLALMQTPVPEALYADLAAAGLARALGEPA